jgi:hypothetical protein
LLGCFLTIDPADLTTTNNSKEEQALKQLECNILVKQANLDAWEQEALEGAVGLSKLISAATVQLEKMLAERETLKTALASASSDNFAEGKHLIAHLASLEGQARIDARLKLKAILPRIIVRVEITARSSQAGSFVVSLVGGKSLSYDAFQSALGMVAVADNNKAATWKHGQVTMKQVG